MNENRQNVFNKKREIILRTFSFTASIIILHILIGFISRAPDMEVINNFNKAIFTRSALLVTVSGVINIISLCIIPEIIQMGEQYTTQYYEKLKDINLGISISFVIISFVTLLLLPICAGDFKNFATNCVVGLTFVFGITPVLYAINRGFNEIIDCLEQPALT